MIRNALVGGLLCAGAAQADVIVTFQEGAPKDRFAVTNQAACATGPMDVTFDLASAPAGLIFDVTGQGAGVEVFQPFDVTGGAALIESVSDIADGDQMLTLRLSDLPPRAEVAFTIDLDDTGGGREITVSGSEIAGAVVRVSTEFALSDGAFDENAAARVVVPSCSS